MARWTARAAVAIEIATRGRTERRRVDVRQELRMDLLQVRLLEVRHQVLTRLVHTAALEDLTNRRRLVLERALARLDAAAPPDDGPTIALVDGGRDQRAVGHLVGRRE